MPAVAAQPYPSDVPEEDVSRLFEEYSGQLLGFCLRQLGSRSEAEDAVQTTFVYALRALRHGVVPECEAAWLTAIAKNVCHWQRRTAARRGPLTSDIDLDTIGLAQPEGDEDHLLVGLKDALASIPENQRRAIVLREWHGVAPREIATELGMSASSTHALLTRARRSLAQALTLPRRPALGVAWAVVDLRSHVKPLFAGISTKAAVATVAVVGVSVGGVAVERSFDPPRSRSPVMAEPTEPIGASSEGGEGTAPATSVPHAREGDKRVTSRGSEPRRSSADSSSVQTLGSSPTHRGGDDRASGVQPVLEHPPTQLGALPTLPLDPPSLPQVKLPTGLKPPVDLPPLPALEPPPTLDPLSLGTAEPLPAELPPSPAPAVPLPPVALPSP